MTETTASGVTDTQERLLDAAESLFAEHGISGTSTRAILRAADQRNESALQYHFGGREGLIESLYRRRGRQVDAERERMLEGFESEKSPDLRRVCEIALLPPVRLARRDRSFVAFLKIVGQLAFAPSEQLQQIQSRYEVATLGRVRELLLERLDLPAQVLAARLELIHRIAAVSLAQRARTGGSFSGKRADLYFDTVLDAMAAVLAGPVSESTAMHLTSNAGKHAR